MRTLVRLIKFLITRNNSELCDNVCIRLIAITRIERTANICELLIIRLTTVCREIAKLRNV